MCGEGLLVRMKQQLLEWPAAESGVELSEEPHSIQRWWWVEFGIAAAREADLQQMHTHYLTHPALTERPAAAAAVAAAAVAELVPV